MTAVLDPSAVRFDPLAHEYWVGDRRLPSVTEILRAVGVSVDFDELAASSPRLGAAIGLKRELGTVLHQDAHALDDDDLDWTTVDPRVKPYLEAWATFRLNSGLTPLSRERLVVHPQHGYAGTLDGIFRAPDGRAILADLKTGDPRHAGAGLQLAAYAAASAFSRPDLVIHEAWAVQLCPGLSVPYRITRFDAVEGWRNWQKFLACLTVFAEQPARRGRA